MVSHTTEQELGAFDNRVLRKISGYERKCGSNRGVERTEAERNWGYI